MMNAKKSPTKHLYKYAFVLPVVLATIFITHALGDRPLQKQEKGAAVVKQEFKLSQKQLKAFEGKYTFQFEKGKDAFLEISAKEDHLMVKELWTGNEMKFVATSELEFYHKERTFPLKFTKSSNGSVTHVLAFNKDLWTKVKEKKSE